MSRRSCRYLVAKGRIWSNTYFQRFKDFEADFLGTSDSERIRWISKVVLQYPWQAQYIGLHLGDALYRCTYVSRDMSTKHGLFVFV